VADTVDRAVLAGALLLLACDTAPPRPGPLPERLTGTGLYVPGSTTAVRPGLLSFSPQYPLWTDGADKRRFIELPEDAAIDASDPDAWQLPAGTRLWKEFSFGGRPVETRFMERLPDRSWRFATYLWLADGSDALLAPSAGQIVEVESPTGRHVIPGQTDCRACHEASPSTVLGFGALQLSPDRDPRAPHATPPARGDVDLADLQARGLLRGFPPALVASPPRIEAATSAARAALGYLHGNCGGCHNAQGPLAPVGLVLAQSVTDRGGAAVLETLEQPSQFQPPAVTTPLERRSVVPLRMRSRDPLLRMPPIGTLAVDEEALALVERFITETGETP
jgi:hypothetical protein